MVSNSYSSLFFIFFRKSGSFLHKNDNILYVNNYVLLKEIDRRLSEYQAALTAADKVLRSPQPQEKLHAAKNKGIWQYYIISKETGSKRTYLPSSKQSVAARIAQRDYALAVKKKVLSWQKKLKAARDLIAETSAVADIPHLSHMSSGRQRLIKPFQLTDSQYAALWLKQSFIQKEMKKDVITYETNKGEKVRSKSEKIIADWLFLHHIPYRYEQRLPLSSSFIVHPDFTVLNVHTRQEIYVEHLGKMDDPRYADDAVMKINKYLTAGHTLGVDVLCTFETKKHPLDTAVLSKVFAELIPFTSSS